MTRRTFSFAALFAAATRVESAGAAIPELLRAEDPDAPRPEPAALPLTATFRVETEGKLWLVYADLSWSGAEPSSVLTHLGSRPAGSLAVTAATATTTQAAQPVLGPVDRREFVSRMGPMPRWAPLVAGTPLTLGPWRFTQVEAAQRLEFSLRVETEGAAADLSGRLTLPPPRRA